MVMLARTAWGVGEVLDSADARLGRWQPVPASKTSSSAEPIGRSPVKFISLFSHQAVIRCPSAGRRPNETQKSYGKISYLLKLLIAIVASARLLDRGRSPYVDRNKTKQLRG